jgi:hypothetical protein
MKKIQVKFSCTCVTLNVEIKSSLEQLKKLFDRPKKNNKNQRETKVDRKHTCIVNTVVDIDSFYVSSGTLLSTVLNYINSLLRYFLRFLIFEIYRYDIFFLPILDFLEFIA